MDPVALLERIRELVRLIRTSPIRTAVKEWGEELAQHVQDLDEWRARGGFDPWESEKTMEAIAEREARRGDRLQ